VALVLGRPKPSRDAEPAGRRRSPNGGEWLSRPPTAAPGCTLGDIVGERVVFAGSLTIAGAALWPAYIIDFALAYLLGIVSIHRDQADERSHPSPSPLARDPAPTRSRSSPSRSASSRARHAGVAQADPLRRGPLVRWAFSDVARIRHAYVLTGRRGSASVERCSSICGSSVLAGYWLVLGRPPDGQPASTRRHGFELTAPERTTALLERYVTISDRQIETSVVLAPSTRRA
jgi:hypothetical protein